MNRRIRALRGLLAAGVLTITTIPASSAQPRFEDVPDPEFNLSASSGDTSTVGRRDLAVHAVGDRTVCALSLEGYRLNAATSEDGGLSFSPEVSVFGADSDVSVETFRSTVDRAGGILVTASVADPNGGRRMEFLRSDDGGRSWTSGVSPLTTGDTVTDAFTWSVKASPTGIVLVAWARTTEDRTSAVWATVSHDGGNHWGLPVRLTDPSRSRVFEPPVVGIDENFDVLYVFYQTRDHATSEDWASGARSFDGGETWESTRALEPNNGPWSDQTFVLDAYVGRNGAVYAATTALLPSDSAVHLRILRSGNYGASWSVVVDEILDDASNGVFPLFDAANLVPSPESETLAIAYMHGDDRISVVRSTNDGYSWEPRRDIPGTAALVENYYDGPSLVAGSGGRWLLAWADDRFRSGGRGADFYLRVSEDDGVTWQPEQRMNSSSTPARTLQHPVAANTGEGGFVSGFRSDDDPASTAPQVYISAIAPEGTSPGVDRRVTEPGSVAATPSAWVVSTARGDRTFFAAWSIPGGVLVSRSDDRGSTWSEPRRAWTTTGTVVVRAASAGPDGALAILASRQPYGAAAELHVLTSEDDGITFAAGSSPLAPSFSGTPAMRVGADGAIFVTWASSGSAFMARSIDGGQSFSTRDLDGGGFASSSPDLCVAGGLIAAVWPGRQPASSRSTMLAATSSDGGETFSPAVDLAGGTEWAFGNNPSVTCATGGRALAVWAGAREYFGFDYAVLAVAFAGSWGPPQPIPIPGNRARQVGSSSVSFVDGAGTEAIAAYQIGQEIYVQRSESESAVFGAARRLDDLGSVPDATSSTPGLVVDGTGRVWIHWNEYAGYPASSVVVSRSVDRGSAFSPPRRLNTDRPEGTFTNLVQVALRRTAGSAVPGTVVIPWVGFRDEAVLNALVNRDVASSPNSPPVAVAGADRTEECSREVRFVLDGSGSYDPDSTAGTQDDIESYTWREGETVLGTDPMIEIPLGLGEHRVVLTVTDRAGESSSDEIVLTVIDTVVPSVTIASPEAGACFGPAAIPVTVEPTVADACDEAPDVTFDPGPGPSYDAHGDLGVTVTATDGSGNSGSASVAFTIDLVAPDVVIDETPDLGRLPTPGSAGMGLLFESSDEDGASGGVVHERVLIDGCVAYDGWEYGDLDGLLGDESLVIGREEFCRLADRCVWETLENPVLRVEATDCGGNAGSAETTIEASVPVARVCSGPSRGPVRSIESERRGVLAGKPAKRGVEFGSGR